MVIVKLGKVIEFEWNEANQEKNWLKHRVSAKESEEAFYDNKKLLLEDIKHSKKEKRFILIGETGNRRMLFTVFTIRNEKIRIISSRDTNRKEEDLYEKAVSIAKI